MPYIDPKRRTASLKPNSVGELTFQLTRDCLNYLHSIDGVYTFSDYAEIIAALECTKQEFYRRAVVPYEEQKIKQNGDLDYHGSVSDWQFEESRDSNYSKSVAGAAQEFGDI